MKVLAVIIACVSLVAARGSGPYLPSGWRPDGPAFYLPSEVSKPVKNPIEDVIFQESEPSGSDALREYGPPKVQEVTQDIAQQGLPDVTNEKLFVETVVKTDGKETSEGVVASVIEQKSEDNTEVKSTIEEIVAVTESQDVKGVISAIKTESVSAIEVENAQSNYEVTTITNVLSVETDEIVSLIEPTVAIETTQEVTNEANSEKSIFESTVEQQLPSIVLESEQVVDAQKETSQQKSEKVDEVVEQASVDAQQVSNEINTQVVDVQQVTSQQEGKEINQAIDKATSVDSAQASSNQKISEESVSQVGQLAVVDTKQVISGSQQESTLVNKQQTEVSKVESSETVSKQAEVNYEVITSVNESIQTVKEEVKKVEEAVQNIPEIIINLENEIKSQKAETIQAVTAVQDNSGSLEQTPEGFLEYGPPGFTEYGPPKDNDLRDNIAEEKPVQVQSIENNEIRKRRFSPKFRPSKKLH